MNKEQIIEKLGTLVRIKSFKQAPNQFIVTFKEGVMFQSYDSIIIIETKGKTYIGGDFDYSTTTGKYRNMFLCETLKETRAKIKSGEYEMIEE